LERALVFPSGLSILIAVFELLEIDAMTLAGGALREGLVYEMVEELRQEDIRARTIASVQNRYQLDHQYGEQVASLAHTLLQQAGGDEWITEPQGKILLETAAKLHEIGLTIDFKKGGEHSAYLLQNLDLPGYTRAQKFFIGEVARRYREQLTSLPEQHALSGSSAKRVLRLLRLAVLLSHRRNPDLEPNVTLTVEGDNLTLHIDEQWLEKNPLTAAELEIESNRQTDIGWPLNIVAK
ncbi:guanosine-5'-triphosphate,3'-diphosphate pyrophosphatase, partial [Vibrio parahaemolyticus]|nr:guanosine-5'-triphosphate,3'-diphosphate pyrophosphatase [Vibrio parahaemolyticus]